MFLGGQAAYGARVVAVIVSLLPLYLTLKTLKEAPFLTKEGRDLVDHPVTIALIAYGTGYSVLGDAAATLNAMVALVIGAFYVFVLRPDLGARYFTKENPPPEENK